MANTIVKYLGLSPDSKKQGRPTPRRWWVGLSIIVAVAVVAFGNLANVSFVWMMGLAVVAGLSWGIAVFLVTRTGTER